MMSYGCVRPQTTALLSGRHAAHQIRAGTVVAYSVGWTGRLREVGRVWQ